MALRSFPQPVCLSLAAAALLLPDIVHGQVWLPRQGFATFGLTYSYFESGDHLFSEDLGGYSSRGYTADGKRIFLGTESSHTVIGGLEYGVTDRIAAFVRLAWVSTKYDGRAPVNLESDDGRWHQTLQDAAIEVRGQVYRGFVVVTPSIGFAFPTSDYFATGHAAQGRHLNALTLAVSAGATLSSVPNMYVQGRYAFGMDEESHGLNLRQSQLEFQVGYYITPSLEVNVFNRNLATHGGVDWISRDPNAPCVHCGDAANLDITVSNSRYVRVGVGTSYYVGRRLSFYGSATTTVFGENTVDANFLVLGTSVDFETPWAPKRLWE